MAHLLNPQLLLKYLCSTLDQSLSFDAMACSVLKKRLMPDLNFFIARMKTKLNMKNNFYVCNSMSLIYDYTCSI